MTAGAQPLVLRHCGPDTRAASSAVITRPADPTWYIACRTLSGLAKGTKIRTHVQRRLE